MTSLDFGTPGNVRPTGGHCCRSMTLGWSFLDLAAAYDAAKAGAAEFTRPDGTKVPIIPDILTIGPMLRLVGVCDVNPLGGGDPFPFPRKVWRCIHNRDDFTCGIYDQRPRMCRTYPTNVPEGRCQYRDCQSRNCDFWPGGEDGKEASKG